MIEYPQREIFRHGRYEMCQVMTNWANDPPKYIACNGLTTGEQFVAHQSMGTWCEVDIITFVNKVNKQVSLLEKYKNLPSEEHG